MNILGSFNKKREEGREGRREARWGAEEEKGRLNPCALSIKQSSVA